MDQLEKQGVDPAVRKLEGETLLEIGAGTGHWTEWLASFGFKITAVDASAGMLEAAREKNIDNATFRQADAEELPFDDATYHNVVMMATLEFIDNPDRALSEIHRVLKPGGYFLIGALNPESSTGKKRHEDPVFSKARFFNRAELRQRLRMIGPRPELHGCALLTFGNRMLKLARMAERTAPQNVLDRYGNFQVGLVRKG